ncbi:MAG: SUMF1/EgtB/PvdO family nonheme iron enzyme [Desulfobacteraceae bacterium]|nr:SUMF1/EgtB/PvdO family nonheme iron enzyme [Desulfobacteraceae bacterium]
MDWYGEEYYNECKKKGIVENPAGPETGSRRVLPGDIVDLNANEQSGQPLYYSLQIFDIVELNANEQRPETDSYRVLRGGSWNYRGQYCRSASRYADIPDVRYSFIGFRLVFVP